MLSHFRRKFSTTIAKRGIEEFIDPTLFEGRELERTGRRWRLWELRQKSYQDLENLWFVCMKERNLLLTMKHLARMMERRVARPGRLGKVRKSMGLIKKVVEERNKLAHQMAKQEFQAKKLAGAYYYPLNATQ